MHEKLLPIKYFKNLDGLRFFAALAVIVGHSQHVVHQYQGYYPYAPWANKLASFGVDFFFVLSGFLISYLLLQEIEKTGTVQIKAFYRRRMLRIFPLYFFVGILGLVVNNFWIQQFEYLSLFGGKYSNYVYSWADFFKNLFFLGTFSVNFQTMFGFHDPVSSFGMGHLWSIAVEEQFYLIWAPLVYFLRRHVYVAILLCIGIGLILSVLPSRLFTDYYEFQYYFTLNRFWHFGLGAAFAWTIQYISIERLRQWLLPSIVSGSEKWLVLGLQMICMVPSMTYLFGSYYEKGTVFLANAAVSLLIIAVAIADFSVFSLFQLEHKALKYLGKISYGIYMFHLFGIFFTYSVLKHMGVPERSNQFYFLVPIVSAIISVGLAAISFQFVEQRFLKLKRR